MSKLRELVCQIYPLGAVDPEKLPVLALLLCAPHPIFLRVSFGFLWICASYAHCACLPLTKCAPLPLSCVRKRAAALAASAAAATNRSASRVAGVACLSVRSVRFAPGNHFFGSSFSLPCFFALVPSFV